MFIKKIDSRIKMIFIIAIFFLFVILLRVLYVQVFDYQKLKILANDLWSRNLPIAANRGKITDRNGIVLADNITTTSLVLVPNQIKDGEKVSNALASILS